MPRVRTIILRTSNLTKLFLFLLPILVLCSILYWQIDHYLGSLERRPYWNPATDWLSKQSSRLDQKATDKRRANAVIVVLTRESDLNDLYESLLQFEYTFNSKFHYPYVILNDQDFSEDFKKKINGVLIERYKRLDEHGNWSATRNVSFGKIPVDHWSYPEWINKFRATNNRELSEATGMMYGGSESYRHMCRFFSGFFYKHPLLLQYDYYWRIEPGASFYCQIDYDPFVFMMDRNLEYGFVMVFGEIMETIPTLWNTTKSYMKEVYSKFKSYRQMAVDVPALKMTLNADDLELQDRYLVKLFNGEDPQEEGEFANVRWSACHYWDNFEIAHFSFFRSPLYQSFFDYLDKAGGFFYERWGDAPVHSLAVGLFLEVSQVHHFTDIGYKHSGFSWCPLKNELVQKCSCNHELPNNMAQFTDSKHCIAFHRVLQQHFNSINSIELPFILKSLSLPMFW